ncbi:MAG: GTP 3',8-cyclase MoaA [Candidatus Omnitrophota bacterium]
MGKIEESRKKIDYLRLSITDRCNLNCIYCTPLEKKDFLTHDEVLRYEEMARIVKLFVKSGIRKVRITGGEPLIKKGIVDLVRIIKEIDGVEELSMTTNGVYLKDFARELKDAGLRGINVSIDTLKRERFKFITGLDCFNNVWQGIEEALEIGLMPLKLNVIPMKGINDDEILDFARLTLEYPITVRFIEFFLVNKRSEALKSRLIENDTVKNKIEEKFSRMEAGPEATGNGPAKYYRLKAGKGLIGFISGSTTNFCNQCNRIRLDCAGRVSPCLFSGCIYDIRSLIRENKKDDEIFARIKRIFKEKSQYKKETINTRRIEMSSIGG